MFRKVFRCSSQLHRYYSSKIGPHQRTWSLLSDEIKIMFGAKKSPKIYPEHADIVIIGGGFIGASVAFWLKTRAGEGLSVVVIEKDTSYSNFQNNIGLGILSQHYSLPENILLSQYAADFLRNSQQYLGNSVDVKFNPHGQLLLASEKYVTVLEDNVSNLQEHGNKCEILSVNEINLRFPWINTADIALGCIGKELEGTFNAWQLLQGLVRKAYELGTIFVNAEVVGFEFQKMKDMLMEGVSPGLYNKMEKVKYRLDNGEEHSVKFSSCVLTAGTESKSIAEKAGIGTSKGLLSIPLPIHKRKYNIYSIENGGQTTGLDTPYVVDTSGLWLHRNGLAKDLLFGQLPFDSEEVKNLSEEEYYKFVIEPSLHNRFPESINSKISHIQEEYIDCNIYDKSGFVGPHPYYVNLIMATGFGKDGCQHSIGLGRAIAELILDSGVYKTIDLTRFAFDRVLTGDTVTETNIY